MKKSTDIVIYYILLSLFLISCAFLIGMFLLDVASYFTNEIKDVPNIMYIFWTLNLINTFWNFYQWRNFIKNKKCITLTT